MLTALFNLVWNTQKSKWTIFVGMPHLIKVFPSFLHPLGPMWVQRGTFICLFIVLNFKISFNFCTRLSFNVICFVKFTKIRKFNIETIST